MNVIIIDFIPWKKCSYILKKKACTMQHAKNTLGFLFSGPVDMDSVQGETSSLVLVREMGGDGI